MPQKLLITGASGFVGRQLAPRLREAGVDLVLVGRDPDQLATTFPGIDTCAYDEIAVKAAGCDAVVHLAVLNNDATASAADFHTVNVDLLEQVMSAAKAAQIRQFINITTFHAVAGKSSPYADSKRRALEVLTAERDLSVTNVFLPAVYGDDFAGKLSILKKVPGVLRPALLTCLSALVPTVHVDRLAAFLARDLDSAPPSVMLANPQDRNPVYWVGKKVVDLLFAVAVIVLLGWLLVIVWAVVRFGSSGPGIFAQDRVGQHGKTFTCYKFRTMKAGTKQAGTHEVTADAVTGIGAVLRKTKIDELPQVWNILRGEVSLVGPRPCLPVQRELIAARQERGVLELVPGITGLAQINGIDMSNPVRLAEMDARYAAQRGLLLDMKIILGTFLGRGQGDRVNLEAAAKDGGA
jgi:lipopolysaccharide/colanic/teichoic acid biosynthesis glycosyltransferase